MIYIVYDLLQGKVYKEAAYMGTAYTYIGM